MVWNWFKKPKPVTREQVKAEGEAITAFLRPLWARYAASLPANDTVPLPTRMKTFVAQMRGPIAKAFPDYKDAPDKIFLNMLVILALEANTHSVDAIEAAMVNIDAPSVEDQVKSDTDAILKVLGSTWLKFHRQLPVAPNAPLAERIDVFSVVAFRGMFENYPSTKSAPIGTLWMMIFTAILESKTHPAAEVNAAIAKLEAKYFRLQRADA